MLTQPQLSGAVQHSCICVMVSVLKHISSNFNLPRVCCRCRWRQVHKGYHHGLRRFVAVKRVNFTNKVRLLLVVLMNEFATSSLG
jgi:hypothetical protein